MADAEGLMTVREAARLAGVRPSQVGVWITWGKLSAHLGNTRGRLVSLAAVQALVSATASPLPREPVLPPPGFDEYVTATVAGSVVGVKRGTVSNWGKQGKVATRPGRYGQLVRLADVLAVAAQSPARRDTAGEGER